MAADVYRSYFVDILGKDYLLVFGNALEEFKESLESAWVSNVGDWSLLAVWAPESSFKENDDYFWQLLLLKVLDWLIMLLVSLTSTIAQENSSSTHALPPRWPSVESRIR